ncbi:hypothetical protein FOA52_004551 [Chlamydomonas sp. UWO 241]|nr:hypothetical protein FOA52_004551 [Chlamydomonas sp. UWO 241]
MIHSVVTRSANSGRSGMSRVKLKRWMFAEGVERDGVGAKVTGVSRKKVTVERGGLLARVQAGSTVGNAIGSVQLATNYTRTVVGGQRPTVGFSG